MKPSVALKPGDVLAVRTDSGLWSSLIRVGAWLEGKSDKANHIVIMDHVDGAGVSWGIEGRPGGVGWVDLRRYDGEWVATTALQPKTDEQRDTVTHWCRQLLGTPYDWEAIVEDGMEAMRIPQLWKSRNFGKLSPANVVCSSLAAWATWKAGLAGPDVSRARWVTPGDYVTWIDRQAWGAPL